MKTPRKAIILAAGFGTRMAPLSHDLPKALLPFWGRPVIDHTLDLLETWGVRDVLINLHHAPQALLQHILKRPSNGKLHITLSFEPTVLGTGGVLRRASWFLDEAPCWMINGDIAADVNPKPLMRAYGKPDTMAALWLTHTEGPRTVEMHDDCIGSFRTRTPGAPGTFTFCGLHLLDSRILTYLPPHPFASIIEAYERAQRKGLAIRGVTDCGSFWADLGTPERLLAAHAKALEAHSKRLKGAMLVSPRTCCSTRALRRRGVTVTGFAAVSPSATVARGAHIAYSIVMDGAHIGPRARVANAVVGPDAHVTGRMERLVMNARHALTPALNRALRALAWPVDKATIECLSPRGSSRSFTRIACGSHAAMLIEYTRDRPENARYAPHARFLARNGIRVPQVIAALPRQGMIVMEDLGQSSLRCVMQNASRRAARAHYTRVVEAIAQWHGTVTTQARQRRIRLEPPFGDAVYAYEHTLFLDCFLRGRYQMEPSLLRAIRSELRIVAKGLGDLPQVLLHRDLQSDNIMLCRGGPAFIDFQGMRYGPAVYDLASLLYDPYVRLPDTLIRHLLARYAQHVDVDPDSLQHDLALGGIERLCQALGAYARLASLPATHRFEQHIIPALERLDPLLADLDFLPKLRDVIRKVSEIETGRSTCT